MKPKLYNLCPRCGKVKDVTNPALSRKDNKTGICSDCGTEEALLDFITRHGEDRRRLN